MTTTIKAIIADDESLARDVVRHYLKEYPFIEIIAEAKNGVDTLNTVLKKQPDLLFLDIQMPDIDGFEVIQSLNTEEMPLIIFVTAYEKFALKAFEVSAVDYLLKPFDKERFDQALQKVLQFSQKEEKLQRNIQQLLSSYEKMLAASNKPSEEYLKKILIKESRRLFFVPIDEVLYFEAAGDYITLFTADKKHIIHESMQRLEKKLDPDQFLRIHRSTILNTSFIKEFQPHFNGEYHIVMKNGATLKMSRTYRIQAKKLLGEE